jgi:hypothetical protein
MAAPHVTGVVALLAGLHPELSAERLVDIIRATTKPIPGVAMKTVTGGMVDAYQALTADPASTFFTPPNHARRVRIARLRISQPRASHFVRKPVFRPHQARFHT